MVHCGQLCLFGMVCSFDGAWWDLNLLQCIVECNFAPQDIVGLWIVQASNVFSPQLKRTLQNSRVTKVLGATKVGRIQGKPTFDFQVTFDAVTVQFLHLTDVTA